MANLTVNDILTDAYLEAYATPEYKASNTLWLKHLHLIVQEVWAKAIKREKASKNWDIWYASTVSLQDEYTTPIVSSTTVWAQFIENIAITYDTTSYSATGLKKYIPCASAMDYQIADWNYYLENQSKDAPIYFERDGSYFIAPDPRTTEVGTNRLKVTGIRSIASWSWTTATTESEMKLPISLIDTLKLGLVWKIHASLARDRNIIKDAKSEYILSMDDAIANMYTEWSFINEFPR